LHVRTGIDMVTVADVAAAVETHGDRYLERVYTATERSDCTRADGTVDAERLAARFAAKEAAVKALRLPEGGFAWTDIELHRHPDGHPELRLLGKAAATGPAVNGRTLDVSFSHEDGRAIAIVVLLFP
jgi:holo-[acyl-carrier protein] synthase